MKISDKPAPIGRIGTRSLTAYGSVEKSAGTPPKAEDRVEISNAAHAKAVRDEAIGLAADAPEIDRAKVDEIRQAIEEGRFKIDAQKIADKLLEENSELGALLN